jgi:hypothetical protein
MISHLSHSDLAMIVAGLVVGKLGSLKMADANLGPSWPFAGLVGAVILLTSYDVPSSVVMFAVTASIAALWTYKRPEAREGEPAKKRRSVLRALDSRRVRIAVSAAVGLAAVLHPSLRAFEVSALLLALMWCYGEWKVLMDRLIIELESVIVSRLGEHSAQAGQLKSALAALRDRCKIS